MSEEITIFYGIHLRSELSDIDVSLINKLDYDINFLIKSYINVSLDKSVVFYDNINIIKTNDKEHDYLSVNIVLNNNKINYSVGNKIYNSIFKLVKNNNIMIKVFKEGIPLHEYEHQLAKVCKEKDDILSKLINKYNNIFQKNFDVNIGLDDIYEKYTGALYFKDYEWINVDNELKRLFETKENESYKYMLPLDNGVILRGSDIYYYYSSEVSRFKKPTHVQIDKWFLNCKQFLDRIVEIRESIKIDNCYDARLILAVVDNVRNIILLLANCELLSENFDTNFLISISTYKENENLNVLIDLINLYQDIICEVCLNNNSDIMEKFNLLIDTTLSYMNITKNKIKKVKNPFILSKCFNPLREIDNYFENYMVMDYISKKIKNKKKISLIGILYGGLELPFILNRILLNKVDNISLIFQNHGMYLDRQVKEKNKCIPSLKIIGQYNYNLSNNYLLDDNVMSGITMQFLINELSLCDCTIKQAIVVRHPNLNRLPQIIHFDTGVNLDLLDKFYLGMVTDTPYTKIKYHTNYNNMFVNELNIFSIMTEVFLKALYNNNSFIKDSQVDIFKGYSFGRKR